jgi:hypothetical protein
MHILLNDIEKKPQTAKRMLGITYDQFIQGFLIKNGSILG